MGKAEVTGIHMEISEFQVVEFLGLVPLKLSPLLAFIFF